MGKSGRERDVIWLGAKADTSLAARMHHMEKVRQRPDDMVERKMETKVVYVTCPVIWCEKMILYPMVRSDDPTANGT